METYKRFLGGVTIFSLIFGVAGVFGLPAPEAHAAFSPSLGTAASYSILAGSEVTNTGASTVSGDVGISPGIGAPPHFTGWGTVTHGGTIHDADGAAATAQADASAAVLALNGQVCDTTFAGAFHELAGDILAPGVYCATSFHLTDGVLTLSGTSADVWIFKSASDFVISGAASDVVFSGGGLACNVWSTVVSSATFAAGSSFVGTFLADTSVTFASGASLDGRAFARTAEVSMVANSITGPTCTPPPGGGGGDGVPLAGTVTVVKTVINDNGGTAVVEDFDLFFDGDAIVSGETNSYVTNPAYQISESANASYSQSFSGDCDEDGIISVSPGDIKFCVITNDDIGAAVVVPPVPPLIDVVKVPSPLALPDGPGSVTYTYTLDNIGTVPVTNVTMVGDTCSPITLTSGDTDSDSQLDVNETWVYNCSTTLTETHTNIITATGWANGLSAVDVASATVVVGVPVIPPLIHVTKVPSPLTLLAGGGMVTYTVTVDNPGAVELHDVEVDDDQCGPMTFVSGDTNGDSLLDVSEDWVYTCQMNVTENTVNTVTVTGDANGFTATDLAVAPVVVAGAVPALPVTGVGSSKNILILVLAATAIAASALVYVARKKM